MAPGRESHVKIENKEGLTRLTRNEKKVCKVNA